MSASADQPLPPPRQTATIEVEPLDLREQIARIDQAQAEAMKLREETQKFVAERGKLDAEAAKLRSDRVMLWATGAAILGGLLTQLPAILRGLRLVG